MHIAGVFVSIVLSLALAGCSFRGAPKTAKTTPPPPRPAPAATVAAQDGPLSIPQTQVQLPPAQPLSPGALALPRETPEPGPEPEPVLPPRPARRSSPAATGPVQPKTEGATAPLPQPPQPAVEERPRLQEIVPVEERKKLADQMAARKHEIDEALRQAAGRPLSYHDRNIVDRIKSFLQLSDQSAARGDMRQADALSDRALILARELRVAR